MGLLFITCPVSAVVYGAGRAADRLLIHRRLSVAILGIGGLALLYVGTRLNLPVIPCEAAKGLLTHAGGGLWQIDYTPVSVWQWIISDPRTTGLSLAVETLAGYLGQFTPERLMIEAEQRREQQRYRLTKHINYIPKRNQLIFGVSGSGKSAYIGRSIEEIIKADPDARIVVVDGKGSTEKYSLYDNLRLISQLYHKPLTLINGTGNEALGGCVYDFLQGVTNADQAKDMVMALIDDPTVQASSGSEHYRTLTEAYILEVINFILRHGVDLTLNNILTLTEPANLKMVMEDINALQDEQRRLNKYTEDNWRDVQASVVKLRMYVNGEGNRLFVGQSDQPRINIREAYRRGDMVLVLADEMSMPSLVQGLVQLVAMDVRSLVSGRLSNTIDMDHRVYVFFDEFTSYTSALPILRSLYGRARSGEVVTTLATQSISDITALPGWFEPIVNTADRFVFFRQHGSESPEAAAGLIGTQLHVTSTARSSDLQFSGEASNTLDYSYIVHPDYIRNLPANQGVMLDKQENKIYHFRNKFVGGN